MQNNRNPINNKLSRNLNIINLIYDKERLAIGTDYIDEGIQSVFESVNFIITAFNQQDESWMIFELRKLRGLLLYIQMPRLAKVANNLLQSLMHKKKDKPLCWMMRQFKKETWLVKRLYQKLNQRAGAIAKQISHWCEEK